MTVYNGMPYLPHAVESILGQTLDRFHFVIVNDGSTDGTAAWLDECAARHSGSPTLEIVHLEKNGGRTAALNRGLALIRSELTAVVDADDLSAPHRLERQLVFLRDHPDIVLVGSDVLYIDGTGNGIGEERFPAEHEPLRDDLPLVNQFAHAACTFRTAAARDAGGYPKELPYAQDMGLWVAMMRQGGKAASIPEPLASIRVHPGQSTKNIALLMVRAKDNHTLAKAMAEIPGLPASSRQAAGLRAAGASWRLGNRRTAVGEAWQAVCEAPFLLPFNPLLWRRVWRILKKILRPAA